MQKNPPQVQAYEGYTSCSAVTLGVWVFESFIIKHYYSVKVKHASFVILTIPHILISFEVTPKGTV